ncbi:hypothetical protein [Aestuariivirga sp.]|uniref:hypothetical protein n=1 Tax=Aestuariivirga sp. TaxID=2650926 RepID=UPI003BACE786
MVITLSSHTKNSSSTSFYVFAATQLSHELLTNLSVTGVIETMILWFAVWLTVTMFADSKWRRAGSAVADGTSRTGAGRRVLISLPYREIVLLGRLPAMVLAITGLLAATHAGDGAAPHLLSDVLLVCSII